MVLANPVKEKTPAEAAATSGYALDTIRRVLGALAVAAEPPVAANRAAPGH